MPKSAMRVEDEYPIPEDTPVPCVLEAVDEMEFDARDRNTKALTGEKYNRWKWTFKVYDGDYAGLSITGLTVPFISSHPDNKVRQWAETLTGKTWGQSEGIDTDDLIGLRCLITVAHQPPKPRKNGEGMFYGYQIADMFPASALANVPPF